MPIITSLLDTDLYKLTMCQAVFHKFPGMWVKYKFKCRNQGITWTNEMVDQIRKEVNDYCDLMFTDEELDWVSKLRYIKKDFVEFLRIYKPQRRHVSIWSQMGDLFIEIEGPWFLTIFFEVPVLAIVNEVYFSQKLPRFFDSDLARSKLKDKIDIAISERFLFSDFGTRRRISKEWQEYVVKTLARQLPRTIFGGTSNMDLARRYGLTPIGTMAHEYICAGQAMDGVTLANSQKYMLQAWVDEYRGDLGTALSDTLGFEKFLKDFDLYFAKLYDGIRHDSGDPFKWARQAINHYEDLRIDPKTKQLTFSDGLTFEKAAALHREFSPYAKVSFGIGTNLTNDVGVEPLQIVIKMVEANGRPVAKISDTPGKLMSDDSEFVSYLKKVCLTN